MTHFRYNDTTKVWERDAGGGIFTAVQENFMGGVVGFGTTSPNTSLAIDANGGIHGIPGVAVFAQTSALAGAGSYVWDTILIDHIYYYTRQNANTEIKVLRAGKYLIGIHATIIALAAGVRNDLLLKKNAGATIICANLSTAGNDGSVTHNFSLVVDAAVNDYFFLTNAAGTRYGEANSLYTRFTITRLN